MPCITLRKEGPHDENDISAQDQTESKGSWFQKENEHCQRQKSSGCQKSKGKKAVIRLRPQLMWPFVFFTAAWPPAGPYAFTLIWSVERQNEAGNVSEEEQ